MPPRTVRLLVKCVSVIVLVCFFLSGAAGLVYQICWIRRASQLFGSTTHAVSTVVAVFFLGLALGSWVFGRVATRVDRPLRIYGIVEIGVGLLALASLPLLDAMSEVFTPVYRAFSGNRAGLLPVQALLVAAAVLPPAIGMGGTLPLYCRHFINSQTEIARRSGGLYSLNTLGAMTGALLTGLWLLPALGLQSSLVIGAALSLASGGVVLAAAGGGRVRDRDREDPPGRTSAPGSLLVSTVFFLVGFVAMAFEVLWVRFLALLVRNTVHTYTLVLGAVLLGIVLGSALAGLLANRSRSRALWFGGLLVLIALAVMGLLMIPPAVWRQLGHELWVCFLALLPPSILSGACFPLAVRMVGDDPRWAALNVGRLGAVNIAGGIVGSLLAGWAGLPALGMALCFSAVAFLALTGGWIVWFRLAHEVPLRWRVTGAVMAGAVWAVTTQVARDRLPRAFLGDAVVAYEEGLGSNLAVLDRDGVLHFEIDRWWQGSSSRTHQMMAAHLPALLHDRPKRVLVVGAGTGQTASRFLLYDIEALHCAEIEPAVFEFIRQHFDSAWMRDPRSRLIIEDGRSYLRHANVTYDILSLEVGQTFRPGVAFFYTRDFYQTAARRLADGGLLVQFVPLPFFSHEQFQGVVRTFLQVFPQATLWYNTSELLLIGCKGRPLTVNATDLQSRLDRPGVRTDLGFSYWGGPAFELGRVDNLLASFLLGPADLHRLSEGGPVYTDDRPRLDYETRLVDESRSDESRSIDALIRHLTPITEVNPPDAARAERVRDANLADMRAQVALRRVDGFRAVGDYAAIVRSLESALKLSPGNVEANRLMGDALLYQQRPGPALDSFEKALGLRPEDVRARYGRAVALHRLGRLQEAIIDYRQAIAARPDDPEYYSNLGAALGQSGQLEKAIQAFHEALRLRPDFPAARDNLRRTEAALGR